MIAPCIVDGKWTTDVIRDIDCNQRHALNSPIGSVVSVSVSYQLHYASVPFAASGANQGLTFMRQFETALKVRPDWIEV